MRRLAASLEAVGATASKLQKIDQLAAYLRTLDDDDLRIVCTYLTGAAFPAGDPRALNVGGSALVEALLDVSGQPESALHESYLRHGDLGSVAFDLLQQKATTSLFAAPLTLRGVHEVFTRMAGAAGGGSRQVKLEGLRALFTDADPLEAKYLVRIITSDLRVGLKEGLLEEAIAKAFDRPVESVRRANMLISDVGEVAVLARAGRLDEAHLRLFRPFRFMLADTIFTPEEAFADRPADAPPLIIEEKYDGIRAQAHWDGTHLAIFTRTLDEITPSFPELHDALRALGGRYIVDGEIVAWRDDAAIPFTQLQQRLRRKNPGVLMAEIPVVMFVFDLLHLDGADLLDRPLAERREALSHLRFGNGVQEAYATRATEPAELAARFRESRDRGNEGLVIKRPESRYQPGRRGSQWVKLKEELAALDVVVVAAEHGHGKRAGVLSDVTFAVRDGDRLAVVGKAYSGLTDQEIQQLTEWFRAHTVRDRGRVKVVEPKIVLEIAFDAVTRSDRHDSGYALRFPRIKRIRDDKTPDEVNTVDDVARIYERQGASRGGASPRLGQGTPGRRRR
ncbi:MAG TPA: ATP-dependent DNA ligase [bacterium]|nr:ATP-dependent DNA ligase [bacterium]